MKQKKHYFPPSISSILLEVEHPTQSSTGAEIPDAGWGAKTRNFSFDKEQEDFSNQQNLWKIYDYKNFN